MTISLSAHLADIQQTSGLPAEEVQRVVHNSSALIDPLARAHLKPELLKAMETALAGALHNVFLVGMLFAVIALVSGFWLPRRDLISSEDARQAVKPSTAKPREEIPSSAAQCERLLMAEMTVIDSENEPAAVETAD
jgi:hypothetical protein